MEFKQEGNLGKTDLLLRHIMLKENRSDDGSILFSKEEIKEIIDQLEKFRHLMSNVNLYANSLMNDQYRGLVGVINELEEYYRYYK
jgi:hypothetical protein